MNKTKDQEPKEQESEIEELKQKIEKLETEKKTYMDGWQRERADALNYRKDESTRLKDMADYALEGLALKIIGVIDNFELAHKHLTQEQQKDPSVQGLLLAKKQLLDILKAQGIEQMSFLGKQFDPNYCDIEQELENQEQEAGMVIEEMYKAYTSKNKLLRPAKVKIAK